MKNSCFWSVCICISIFFVDSLFLYFFFFFSFHMFIKIIGMTSSSNLHSRLEKRVISRLNAQFIVVPRLDLNTLLYEYKRLLILPEFSSDLLDISSFSSSLVSSPEFIRNYSVYRSQFNEIVTRVLAYGDDSDDNHNNNSNNSNNNTLYA